MIPLHRVTLPNSISVWAPNALEAMTLYREIFSERTYEKHGIMVRDGDTVFDIGANIGLFTVNLAHKFTDLHLYAFEPVPDIYDALQRNATEHAPAARCYNIGLTDRRCEAVFELNRFATLASTMHPTVFDDGARKNASLAQWAEAGLADLEKVHPEKWVALTRRGLKKRGWRYGVLAVLGVCVLALHLRRLLYLQRRVCKLRTVSEVLAETGVDFVDLMKIDVEGAEESILAGIVNSDWDRIGQFVIEVHDVEGRLDRMTKLLENRGYRTVRAREDWALHELMSIWTLYALRSAQ